MTASLDPIPQSIAGIRTQLRRDRRGDERRWGKKDTRIFRYNRRSLERRIPRDTSEGAVDDDMIVEISELVSELELLSLERDDGKAELTCIQERPDLSNI
ncbi:MAG: hypothetical protein JKY56_16560 [Kofleriaceae bacterium]|nr:hypothetical protein [Kofleriaceae bacterium]